MFWPLEVSCKNLVRKVPLLAAMMGEQGLFHVPIMAHACLAPLMNHVHLVSYCTTAYVESVIKHEILQPWCVCHVSLRIIILPCHILVAEGHAWPISYDMALNYDWPIIVCVRH
jgi:hypothetical protein